MSVSHPDGLSYLLDVKEVLGSSYDEVADVLYLWRSEKPAEGVSLTSEEGHLVRFDPESFELVGFTIYDFHRRWQEDDPHTTLVVTVPSLGRQRGEVSKPQKHELVPA